MILIGDAEARRAGGKMPRIARVEEFGLRMCSKIRAAVHFVGRKDTGATGRNRQ